MYVFYLCTYFRIPGQLTDRRTMLGELNWIFTAITDTIAWNTLPRGKRFELYKFTVIQNKSMIILIIKIKCFL